MVGHVSFADPYCSELAPIAAGAATEHGITVHCGGTVVVVQGPRFSTRAESAWFRSMGATVVNMTQHPEAVLARELGICFCGLASITDYDSGVPSRDDVGEVTIEEVFAGGQRGPHPDAAADDDPEHPGDTVMHLRLRAPRRPAGAGAALSQARPSSW